ncbi:MAG: DUF3347 domain-containing protein [Flavobacteriales bacterium]|jgi:copper chaperone CopZ|nr:DUF3347 domain-containing protein [Flavobacteriales bacterium]
MITKNLFAIMSTVLLLSSCSAQMKNAQTTTLRVDGDCPMCEKTIEKVAYVKGEAEADWDVEAKTARITIDAKRTTVDAVLKRIAQAGYDSEKFLAPDAAYAALPGCCQYERSFKKAPLATASMGHDGHAQEGTATPDSLAAQKPMNPKSDQFNALFTAYFALKDALVASDAKTAAVQAAALSSAVKAVQMERMGPELHGVWMQVMEPMASTSAGIASKTDIHAQRKAFAELSPHMLTLVKVAPRPDPVYYDHCPMYEGGANWLSMEKPIKNPFYGSMMMTCGTVKQTIP